MPGKRQSPEKHRTSVRSIGFTMPQAFQRALAGCGGRPAGCPGCQVASAILSGTVNRVLGSQARTVVAFNRGAPCKPHTSLHLPHAIKG